MSAADYDERATWEYRQQFERKKMSEQPAEIPTPRTDAARQAGGGSSSVRAHIDPLYDEGQKLERELTAVTKERDELRANNRYQRGYHDGEESIKRKINPVIEAKLLAHKIALAKVKEALAVSIKLLKDEGDTALADGLQTQLTAINQLEEKKDE